MGVKTLSYGLLCGVCLIGLTAATKPTPPKQKVTGPVAEYWMTTSTYGGFSMNGGKPDMGSMMSMMGGGSNIGHSLRLELQSASKPTATPSSADHFVPTALGVGQSLPLLYKVDPKKPYIPTEERPYEEGEPPKGKILIFWGCGEHAPKGQPIVIDLAKVTDPKARWAEFKKFQGQHVALSSVRGPSPSAAPSFGEWPNYKSSKSFGSAASLVGAHRIKGNYSPEINFNLTANQDFLSPISMVQNAVLGSGAVGLGWKPVDRATGYYISMMGGNGDTMVMWSSSAVQTDWFMAHDYLTPADAAKLVAQKILLAPQTTSCAIPAEAKKAAGEGMFAMTAYGDETNMAYPPRPEDPKIDWNIQWTVKVRYNSTYGGLVGEEMGAMGGDEDRTTSPEEPKKKKKKGFGLGDIVEGATGIRIP